MLITTKSIVIGTVKFSEADLIVKCFTKSNGPKTYLLRNVLKSKKGKLKTSMFQVLNQLEIVASHKEKDSLEYIREAKVINTYKSFHSNIYKSTIVIFLAEILRNSIQEEEQNVALYDFLEKQFIWLDENQEISNFHLFFLLHLTKFLGFFPETKNAQLPYFNMLDGTFQKTDNNSYCFTEPKLELWKNLLKTSLEQQNTLKLNQSKRNILLSVIMDYYTLHLQNFKKPKSIAVLHEIFN